MKAERQQNQPGVVTVQVRAVYLNALKELESARKMAALCSELYNKGKGEVTLIIDTEKINSARRYVTVSLSLNSGSCSTAVMDLIQAIAEKYVGEVIEGEVAISKLLTDYPDLILGEKL
jgi:hypothetical protein